MLEAIIPYVVSLPADENLNTTLVRKKCYRLHAATRPHYAIVELRYGIAFFCAQS